jgi:hypothetical protein
MDINCEETRRIEEAQAVIDKMPSTSAVNEFEDDEDVTDLISCVS